MADVGLQDTRCLMAALGPVDSCIHNVEKVVAVSVEGSSPGLSDPPLDSSATPNQPCLRSHGTSLLVTIYSRPSMKLIPTPHCRADAGPGTVQGSGAHWEAHRGPGPSGLCE